LRGISGLSPPSISRITPPKVAVTTPIVTTIDALVPGGERPVGADDTEQGKPRRVELAVVRANIRGVF